MEQVEIFLERQRRRWRERVLYHRVQVHAALCIWVSLEFTYMDFQAKLAKGAEEKRKIRRKKK